MKGLYKVIADQEGELHDLKGDITDLEANFSLMVQSRDALIEDQARKILRLNRCNTEIQRLDAKNEELQRDNDHQAYIIKGGLAEITKLRPEIMKLRTGEKFLGAQITDLLDQNDALRKRIMQDDSKISDLARQVNTQIKEHHCYVTENKIKEQFAIKNQLGELVKFVTPLMTCLEEIVFAYEHLPASIFQTKVIEALKKERTA